MGRYRVLQKSFLNNQTYNVGEEVEWDGIPATNLEPIDKAAQAAAAAAQTSGQPITVPEEWNPTPSMPLKG
jgi:hypothetical protein